MNEKRSEELTREERVAFEMLHASAEPSPACEENVIGALRESGLVRREPRVLRFWRSIPVVPRLVVAGASLALAFGFGMEFGKRSARTITPSEAQLEVPGEEAIQDDGSGAQMARYETEVREEESPEVRIEFASNGKPVIASLEGADLVGDFPLYPLDGRDHGDHAVAPKYR